MVSLPLLGVVRHSASCLRLAGVALVALGLFFAVPQGAQAHAVLEGSAPGRGAELGRAPGRVVFRFSEPVEAAFGAVRVYDQRGERVDRGSTGHPEGRGHAVAVKLDTGLGEGAYTATYRVVSADSHPVSGGVVFTVGHAGTPAESLDELIEAGGSGPLTETVFGIVRGLSYLALALGIGSVVFVAAVWHPALRGCAGADDGWLAASDAFAARTRMLVGAGVAVGALSSGLGIVLQGAIASGSSLWQALDPAVIGDVLGTRFGTVWGLRLLAWLAVAGLLVLPAARLRAPVLRPASLGATGLATAPPATAPGVAGLAGLLAFLCLTPALAGHASTIDPTWLLVPANFVHVVCMTVWVGGVAMLLVALPGATGRLDPSERTRLLAAAVGRFSRLALAAVIGLVAGGTVQAIAELQALSDLTNTPFGRAILIKIALLLALIALGAWNRQRARPRLAALAASGANPGATGLALRRSLRTELALMAAVLAVTAALVSYAPASDATGPFSADTALGPARLELTVDPARAGRNQLHLYLFDRRTGRQYDRVKELTVSARLPDRSIGPLALQPEKAGPGHYLIRRADIAPPGEWRLSLSARVSAFDAYTARIEVPIR